MSNTLRGGMRVETSGRGRTRGWGTPGAYRGMVTKRRGNRVFVRWDGLHFEDEMSRAELRPERKDGHQ